MKMCAMVPLMTGRGKMQATFRRWIERSGMLAVLISLLGIPARAADEFVLETSLFPKELTVGEEAMLKVTLYGLPAEGIDKTPDSEGLSVRYLSGEASARGGSYTYLYGVLASTHGEHAIPAIQFQINGEITTTKPFKVEAKLPNPEALHEKSELPHFLEVDLEKREFYVGEVIPIRFSIHASTRTRVVDWGVPKITNSKVLLKRFESGPDWNRRINNRRFDVREFDSFIAVIQPGTFDLGPVECILQTNEASLGANNRVTREFVPHKLKSGPLLVKVLPFPENGKPDSFNGAVGKFTMTNRTQSQNTSVGEPVLVEFEIKGKGALEAISSPVPVDPDGWKFYPAQEKTNPVLWGRNGGTKTVSRFASPLSATDEIPAFELSYFDPDERKYVTLRTPPIPIEVNAAESGSNVGETSASNFPDTPETPDVTADTPPSEIVEEIRSTVSLRREPVGAIHRNPWFWIAQGVPAVGLLGLIAFTVVSRRREARVPNPSEERKKEVWAALQGANGDRRTFYKLVDQFLELNDATDSELREIAESVAYGSRNEGGEREDGIGSEERNAVMTQLKQLR